MEEKRISHDGIVDSQDGNELVIRITSYAACNGCHARGACSVTEEKEKFMRVKTAPSQYSKGDKVRVVLAQSLGFRALFLGYVLPFLLVLCTLLLVSALGNSELIAGVSSLAVLIPYYIGLKMFRGKLERQFSFILQKI